MKLELSKNGIASLLMLLQFALPTVSRAGGNEGHGGSWLYLIDGTPKLADLFVKSSGVSMQPSKELYQVMDAIKDLLKIYGVESEDFWTKYVKSRRADYRWVATSDDLPCKNLMEVDPKRAPEMHREAQYGCTTDSGATFLAHSELDGKPFELQSLAVLHERLHAFAPKADHDVIAPFIEAISLLIDIGKEQAAGVRRTFSEDEIEIVRQGLYHQGAILGFTITVAATEKTERVRFLPGGGLCQDDCGSIDDESLIGVGSLILGQSTVAGRSVLIGTRVERSELKNVEAKGCAFFASNAKGLYCTNSRIDHTTAKDDASVKDSEIRIEHSESLVIEAGVQVAGLAFHPNWEGGIVTNTELTLAPASGKLVFFPQVRCMFPRGGRVRSFIGGTTREQFRGDERQFIQNWCRR